ncbi:MaoC family dehydratase [Sphingobium sp. Cam5-1]|uniref:MaoC family dehydratase n=1 Tax=Sphingobium sp. Cam5-1 TaxID=2789327 RepID=UPI0018AD1262|nr:MaoC family dehydratase [Sphingobium sp. Cam5-1]QPI75048.1 MaoC family dehydratase [Sphingobium sp. Cam5-1]
MIGVFDSFDSICALIGKPLGPGEWVEIDQDRINSFADVTGDHQWIHVDEARAKHGPFGTTIAHGLLTLSLLPALNTGVFRFEGFKMGVNYGYGKVRFPSPVPVGSRIRLSPKILSCQMIQGNVVETILECTVEREGSEKPACVAEMIFRHYPK